jgi:transcriptional regulator with XRE-family HTH domain
MVKRPVDGRIGVRLAEVRKARGMSQGRLARAIGVSVGLVQAYERITVERLEDLAAVLQCEPADLITRGPGRPATGVDPMMSFRLPVEIRKAVEKWSKEKGLSRSEGLRLLIEKGLKQ